METMLKTTLAYSVTIVFAAAATAGVFMVMMALSRPESYETLKQIKDALSIGAPLAFIGFLGTFSLSRIFKTHVNLYLTAVGVFISIPIFFISLSGLIFTLESVLAHNHGLTPYLFASLVFGIFVFALGFEFFSRIFGFPIPLVFIYWTPVILFNPEFLEFLPHAQEKNTGTFKIIAIVALVIGVVAGMGVFNFLGQEYASKQMILENGMHVSGTVIQKTEGYDDEDSSVYIKYNFVSPSGELITSSKSIPLEAWANLQEGSSIDIAFDPADVSESIPALGLEEPPFWISYGVGFISGLVAFFAQFYIIAWLRTVIARLRKR